MGLALALLGTLLAILLCLGFLLVLGVIYFEFTNSDIPPGLAQPGKLRLIHGVMIGMAVLGKIMENFGACSQVVFNRYIRDRVLTKKIGEDPKLLIKDLHFEEVPVRVYQPKAPSAGGRKGVLFFHGGGWMFGSIESYDKLCRNISKETESVVVSVGYRLSPEHRYPAHYEDCFNATVHFLKTAGDYGVDPSRIIISGDSAGGTLAASVCQGLVSRTGLPKLSAQVLIYPLVQMADFNLPSYQQNRSVPILYRERVAFYVLQYLNGDLSLIEEVLEGEHIPEDMKLKYEKWLSLDNIPAEFKVRDYKPHKVSSQEENVSEQVKDAFEMASSPLLSEDDIIRSLPKAYILTCEYDVLRDDGLLYKKRLEDNGVSVTWYHVRDGFHGVVSFFDDSYFSFPAGKLAMADIVNFIKSV
ncbi:arylacetamide deacetylase-like 4 [Ambystoma mexicanum]|uniref:arylacetamide deacetylase-like 4 n=1 Tax=Ambystoma mexicanum TaxID=8296 RepID=UPI0037E814FA